MKRKARITGLQKFQDSFENTSWHEWPKGVKVFYNNPADVLRYELSTKRGLQAMGFSKENVEMMLPSYKTDEVVAQCEAEELGGSIFLIIAELTEKLRVLRLALHLEFSKKSLRRLQAVERELEILLASLHSQQRIILVMTRVQDAPGFDKSILRSKYYKLPLPFKRWRDTSEKGSEEELMFIPVTGMQHNFSNTKLKSICTMLTDYSAQSIPLWHLRKAG